MRTGKFILALAVIGGGAGFVLPNPLAAADPPREAYPRIGVDVDLPRQLGPVRQSEPEAPPMRCDRVPATALCQAKIVV